MAASSKVGYTRLDSSRNFGSYPDSCQRSPSNRYPKPRNDIEDGKEDAKRVHHMCDSNYDYQHHRQLLPRNNDHQRKKAGRCQTNLSPRPQLEIKDDVDLPNILALRENNWTWLLPPLASDKTRTIVLDLDETLVHSSPDPPPETYDSMIKPSIYGLRMNFYVWKIPRVDKFLEAISKKYEVVVVIAGLEPYASLLLDILDPRA
ncbi:uncharacterized protein C2F7.02c-like [Gossypium hirsutum]|uniref:Mitochondrial import inner membrane translocase subunit TIM50 n=1 Tax=Gossypium hirsutum TaxID=3635 RepID=A0ABM3A9L4_GOSHI|nr:uncharacterized protein C2F7.02c-like [Gossypium hirsutum]